MPHLPLKIFFSGIGGSGMSAIACFMSDRGHIIVGSDRAFDRNPSHPLYGLLKSKGISIVPQDGSGIDGSFDYTVFSTAVESERPEVIKAKALGVPIKTRPEYLAEIVRGFNTIAVAGTSGKSTTAGMLAFLLQRLGLNPNFIGGGRVKQFHSETNPGNSLTGDSNLLVFEACESDGTIVSYKPLHSIILNLDLDHNSVDKTAGMFNTLMENTSIMVIVNADDINMRKLHADNAITFSIDNPSDYRAIDIVYNPFSTEFSIRNTRLSLSMPGKHNLYNAISCISMLDKTGIPFEDIARVLPEFQGIERRFDIHIDDGKSLVIDDYAHNPHKISSLMDTVKNLRKNICYIFQPHGFAPTRMMKKEYIGTFIRNLRGSDHLMLLPIFYSGGTVSKDISSHDLAEGIRAGGKSVEVVDERRTILERVREWDTYVIFGARDDSLSDFAKDIAGSLRNK